MLWRQATRVKDPWASLKAGAGKGVQRKSKKEYEIGRERKRMEGTTERERDRDGGGTEKGRREGKSEWERSSEDLSVLSPIQPLLIGRIYHVPGSTLSTGEQRQGTPSFPAIKDLHANVENEQNNKMPTMAESPLQREP